MQHCNFADKKCSVAYAPRVSKRHEPIFSASLLSTMKTILVLPYVTFTISTITLKNREQSIFTWTKAYSRRVLALLSPYTCCQFTMLKTIVLAQSSKKARELFLSTSTHDVLRVRTSKSYELIQCVSRYEPKIISTKCRAMDVGAYWKSKFNFVQLIVIVSEQPVWCPAHLLAHTLAHKLIIRVRIPKCRRREVEKQNLSVFTRKAFGIPKLVCRCYLRWYRVKVMRWFYVVQIQDAYLNINHLWYRRMCTLEVGSPKVSRRRGGVETCDDLCSTYWFSK